MRRANYFFYSLMALSLIWVLTGCQPDELPPNTIGGPTSELSIDMLGTTHPVMLDSEGRAVANASLMSQDGTVILSIDKGTQLLDGNKKPLDHMSLVTIDSLPLPPENTQLMGSLYELLPEEVTANPYLRLTLTYDPEGLPEVVKESDVYIAPYDEAGGWGKWSYKNVDTNNNRVTTQISSSVLFAVLIPMPPAPSQPVPTTPAQSGQIVSLKEALSNGKPTLAEFGSSTCVPCKQMKPILEQLAAEYDGQLNVAIVEVYEQMELTRYYKIAVIPTQIVFDSSGKEITKHIGLWPKEQILIQLKNMGVE